MSQKFNYTRNPYPVVLPAIGRVTMLFALTFTLATVLAGTLSAAETTLDFSANPTVGAEQKAPDGIVCEISPAPQAVGKAVFKLEWPAHEGKHIAGHLQVPGDVLIDKPGKYKITARVCLEQLGPNAHASPCASAIKAGKSGNSPPRSPPANRDGQPSRGLSTPSRQTPPPASVNRGAETKTNASISPSACVDSHCPSQSGKPAAVRSGSIR